MSRSKKLLGGSAVITAGRLGGYALSFVRNMILARILTKADFGLAALLASTVALLEIASRMAFGPQLIQARDGDTPEFQATSHTFQFALGLAGVTLFLALSHPIAAAMKLVPYEWAIASLAIIPFARGLEHLDNYRQQRELNYWPAALCEVLPHIVITLAAWPLALWLRDYRVIVWLTIGKAALGTLVTHLLARRPYRWGWRGDFVWRMWTFGWPLLLNSLVMFGAQQGDQLLVGRYVSLADLASYSLVGSLVNIPWFIFGQAVGSIMLPVLARAQENPGQLRHYYRRFVECAAVGAVLTMLPLIVSGEHFIKLFYGHKYAGAGPLMALLGAAAAVRFLRFVPATAAMARADTINQLYSSLCRAVSLPLAAAVALRGGGLLGIAVCPLAAEIAAATFSVQRLSWRQGIPLRDTLTAALYVLGFVGAGLAFLWLGAARWQPWTAGAASLGLTAAALLVGWIIFPQFAQAFGRRAGAPRPLAPAEAPVKGMS